MCARQFLDCFSKFPEISSPNAKTSNHSEIPEAFAYKSKSMLRTLVESGFDFFNLRFVKLLNALLYAYLFGQIPMIFTNLGLPCTKKQTYRLKRCSCLLVQVQMTEISRFLNIDFLRIKDGGPCSHVSLASYQSTDQPQLLQIEVNRLSEVLHHPLNDIRQHLVSFVFQQLMTILQN